MDELIHGFYLVEGKLGIYGMYNGRNALGHACGIAKGAYCQARLRPWGLPEGNVDFREALAPHSAVVNVMVEPDNLPLDVRAELGDSGKQLLDGRALREGIHFGQVFFHKGFIHDRDGHAACGVLLGERAASDHANAKCAEIFGSDHIEAGARTGGGIVNSLSREVERHAKVCPDDGHARGSRDGRDSGERADLIDELTVKGVV